MSFYHAYINDWKYKNRNTKLSKNHHILNLGLFLIVEWGSVLWELPWAFRRAVTHLENQF